MIVLLICGSRRFHLHLDSNCLHLCCFLLILGWQLFTSLLLPLLPPLPHPLMEIVDICCFLFFLFLLRWQLFTSLLLPPPPMVIVYIVASPSYSSFDGNCLHLCCFLLILRWQLFTSLLLPLPSSSSFSSSSSLDGNCLHLCFLLFRLLLIL